MPKRIEGDILTELRNLYMNKDSHNIALLIADAYRDLFENETEESINNIAGIKAFFAEVFGPDAYTITANAEKEGRAIRNDELQIKEPEFLKELFAELDDIYIEAALEVGPARDEVVYKIKNGKVKHTELIADDDSMVDKIAHDIVMSTELDCRAIAQMRVDILTPISGKYIGKDRAEDVLTKAQNTKIASEMFESKLGTHDFSRYLDEFANSDVNESTGFVVKNTPFKLRENTEAFSEYPEYIKRVEECSTLNELEQYEAEIYQTIFRQERFEQEIKSDVKVAKHLLNELEPICKDRPEEDLSKKVYTDLENLSHIGTDYVKKSEGDLVFEPVSAIAHNVVNDALNSFIITHMDNENKPYTDRTYNLYKDKTYALYEQNPEDTPVKKEAYIAQCIKYLADNIQDCTDGIKKAKIFPDKIEECKKALKFIEKKKRSFGCVKLTNKIEDDFTKSLDETMTAISDSLASDCVSNKVYNDLFIELLEYKRVYAKPIYVYKVEDGSYQAEVSKKNTVLRAKADKIKTLVDKCITYDKANAEENAGIIKSTFNRIDALKGLKKLPLYKAPKFNVDNYDAYIDMHLYNRAGTNSKERVDSLAKVMAAMFLRKLKKKFNHDEINKTAKYLKAYCGLNSYLDEHYSKELKEALKGEDKVIALAVRDNISFEGVRLSIYDAVGRDDSSVAFANKLDEEDIAKYKDDVNGLLAIAGDKSLKNTYGPKGKIFNTFRLKEDYDKIEIDIPEGMDEDLVTAVILGSMCNPDEVKDLYTTSSGASRDVSMINYTFLFDNMASGDSRQGNFPEHMVKSRALAKDALDKCKNGDYSAVLPFIKYLLTGIAMASRSSSVMDTSLTSGYYTSRLQVFNLVNKIINNPKFNVKDVPSPIEHARIKANIKMLEAGRRTLSLKKQLFDNPPSPNTKQREEAVKQLIFDTFVANIGAHELDNNFDRAEEFIKKMFKDIDLPSNDSAKYGLSSDIIRVDVVEGITRYTMSDLIAILAEDDGYDRIKNLFMDSIIKHPLYRDMVSCDNKYLVSGMEEMDKLTRRESDKLFSDVKIPSAADKYNTKDAKNKLTESNYENARFLRKCAPDRIVNHNITPRDYYKPDGLDEKTANECIGHVDNFLTKLKSVDKSLVKSSAEFKRFKTALEAFDNHIKSMKDRSWGFTYKEYSKFIELADAVRLAADGYLAMKVDPKSDYAKSRVRTVFEINSKINYVSAGLKKSFEDHVKEKLNVDEITDEIRAKIAKQDRTVIPNEMSEAAYKHDVAKKIKNYHLEELDPDSRETYALTVNGQVNNKNNRNLLDIMGPNGVTFDSNVLKDRIDEIQIPIPEGLDEELVTAVIIGAMCDPDLLEDVTAPSVERNGNKMEDKYTFLFEKMTRRIGVSPNEQGTFPNLMLDGRKRAREAILAYQKGDKSEFETLLGYFIKGIARVSRSKVIYNTKNAIAVNNEKHQLQMLASKVVSDQRFNISRKVSAYDMARVIAASKALEAAKRSVEIKKQLLEAPGEKASNERQAFAKDLIANIFIANIMQAENVKFKDRAAVKLDEILLNMGIDKSNKLYRMLKNNSAISVLAETIAKNSVDDLVALLAREDGYDKVKSLIDKEILTSPMYTMLVTADKESIADVCSLIDSNMGEYADSIFENIKIPKAEAPYKTDSKRFDKSINSFIKSYRRNACDILRNEDADALTDDFIYVGALDDEGISDCATFVSRSLKELEGVDKSHIKSSSEFKEFKTALIELDKYISTLKKKSRGLTIDEFDKFKEMLDAVDEAADDYLSMKTNPSSDYAKSRVKTVFKIKSVLANIYQSTTDYYDNKMKEASAKFVQSAENSGTVYEMVVDNEVNMVNFFCAKNSEGNDPFRAKSANYKEGDLPNIGKFTTTRTSLYTFATLALAMEKDENGNPKYSIESLLNSSEFVDEKSKMFDKVIEQMNLDNHESRIWLAERAHYGSKAIVTMMDEYAKDLDFTDNKIYNNVKFRRLQMLGYYLFDIGQETEHLKEEVLEVARRDNPDIKNYDEYESAVSGYKGLGCFYYKTNLELSKNLKELSKKDPVTGSACIGAFIGNVIVKEVLKKIIKDTGNNGKYSKRVNESLDYALACLSGNMLAKYGKLMNYEEYKVVGDILTTGKLTKNMKIELDLDNPIPQERIKVTGILTREEVEQEYRKRTMPKSMEKAQKEVVKEAYKAINSLKTFPYSEVYEVVDDIAKAFTGRIIEVNGSLPKKPGSDRRYTVDEYESVLMKSDKLISAVKKFKTLKAAATHYSKLAVKDADIKKFLEAPAKKPAANGKAVANAVNEAQIVKGNKVSGPKMNK